MNKLIDSDRLSKLAQSLDARSKERAVQVESKIDETKAMFDGRSFRYVTQKEYDNLPENQKNDTSIVWVITDAEELEIDLIQTKEDLNLFTEDKTVVGAINSLLDSIENIEDELVSMDSNITAELNKKLEEADIQFVNENDIAIIMSKLDS